MEYTIIDFDQTTAQVILRIDDGTKYADTAVDLPIDENNRIPEGEELHNYLQAYVPDVYDARLKQIEANGIANPEAVVVNKPIEPPHEVTAEEVRTSRNIALLESDWTQLTDAPLTAEEKAAWAEYRQGLRDLTAQEGFPTDLTWPTSPDADLA